MKYVFELKNSYGEDLFESFIFDENNLFILFVHDVCAIEVCKSCSQRYELIYFIYDGMRLGRRVFYKVQDVYNYIQKELLDRIRYR